MLYIEIPRDGYEKDALEQRAVNMTVAQNGHIGKQKKALEP
jgi:hypothetical protein